MSTPERMPEDRLRNTRAWAAARVGQMSGAEVIVSAIDELLNLRECLSDIEDFARGEGDVGNIIARKAAAQLRPETAPPAHQP